MDEKNKNTDKRSLVNRNKTTAIKNEERIHLGKKTDVKAGSLPLD